MLFRWRNYDRCNAGDEVLPMQEKNNDKKAKIKIVCDFRRLSLYGLSSDYRGPFSQRAVRDRVTMNWM